MKLCCSGGGGGGYEYCDVPRVGSYTGRLDVEGGDLMGSRNSGWGWKGTNGRAVDVGVE